LELPGCGFLAVYVVSGMVDVVCGASEYFGIRLFEREYSLDELVLNGVLLFVIIGPIVMVMLGIPYALYRLIRWKLKK
jgi:hypothetical protein